MLAAHPLLSDPDVNALLKVLSCDGEEARIVGGAVRDAIMGFGRGDVDIATTAHPSIVISRVEAAGWKAVPTGLEHGTVTVVIKSRPYEVTTLRRDVATDGRRAVVAFTRDFGEDAYRRDFTINALSLSGDGTVHDYATGLEDAANGRVRFMGDSAKRIEEDYLRILRFFRFHASHGKGRPDEDGLAACAALKSGLSRLSRERIRQELLKLLVARGAEPLIKVMKDIALWPAIFKDTKPDASALIRLIRLEKALDRQPDGILRLAALLADISPDKCDLKLSRHEQLRLSALDRHASAFGPVPPGTADLRRLAFIVEQHFEAALLLGHARVGLDLKYTQEWLRLSAPVVSNLPKNPFKAAQVAALGVPAGPRMGAVLQEALRLWLDAGLPEDRTVQATLMRRAIALHEG